MADKIDETWRVGDAGFTIFGPNLGEISPETIATVKKKKNAPVLAAAPDLLTQMKKNLEFMQSLQGRPLWGSAAVTRALLQKRIEATEVVIARAERKL